MVSRRYPFHTRQLPGSLSWRVMIITSGINPPCRKAKSARQARKELRVLRANCEAETTEKRTIWVGIHRSGPSHLANNWAGNSPARKHTA